MSLTVRELDIPGVLEITPKKFGDDRGFFSETFNAQRCAEAGVDVTWVQDNHSLSASAGVLRGLHYQLPPHAQDKLVRVVRGRVFDVVADIRPGSATFGRWVGVELSVEKWNQLFVPKGFAHGFLTLEPNTELLYKVSDFYSPECDRSIRFDDPDLGIEWPIEGGGLILSEKDEQAPSFKASDLPAEW